MNSIDAPDRGRSWTRSWRRRACWLLLACSLPLCVPAQSGGSYRVRKQVIAAGIVASGGSYRLTGTVGQPVAAVQSAGNYRLTGGFHGPQADADRLLCNGFEDSGCP